MKYADADETQAAVDESAAALEELRVRVATIRRELLELQAGQEGRASS